MSLGIGWKCPNCDARCSDTSRELKRFQRRHPALCTARKAFAKQLAQGTRSVEPTTWEEHQAQRNDGEDLISFYPNRYEGKP